jgi:hypothetical protein
LYLLRKKNNSKGNNTITSVTTAVTTSHPNYMTLCSHNLMLAHVTIWLADEQKTRRPENNLFTAVVNMT